LTVRQVALKIERMSADVAGELPGTVELMTVAQAIRLIDQAPVAPRVARVPLSEAAGMRLAADLHADRDYPPFRKSLMDGYALRCADVVRVPVELQCIGEVAAGQSPTQPVGPGQAIAIMTGAPLPDGADGVVPVEDVERRASPGEVVRVLRAPLPNRYIAQSGSDCRAGKLVLPRGTLLGPAQIAVAASIGAATVSVYVRPRVGVLGTGDELVPVDAAPAPSQIRNSNVPMLTALLRRLGCDAIDLGVARDNPEQIREAISRGLMLDVLFITGGMSMGAYDYVPRVLRELGVNLKITKLRIKPGKPFVFGIAGEGSGFRVQPAVSAAEPGSEEDGASNDAQRDTGVSPVRGASEVAKPGSAEAPHTQHGRDARATTSGTAPVTPVGSASADAEPHLRATGTSAKADPTQTTHSPIPSPHSTYVFGLPGNPVSSYVCTIRLAARLLTRMGGGSIEERWLTGRLDAGLPANGPREFYQPAVRSVAHGAYSSRSEFAAITPLMWKGSADLFTLAAANVLLVRAENEPPIPKGSVVRVFEI
jgi:molybdopterin molybdotransferase